MTSEIARTRARLETLCLTHPDRHVGGQGNHEACEFFASEVLAAGFEVERIPFQCVDWEFGGASLTVADGVIPLHVGPYSPPFTGSGRLACAATIDELESLDATGAILLLHGAIASEQVTPRDYPFYQMPEHERLLAALDRAAPAAVIAATDRTPMAAALRPFPLFEDANLGVPSAYLLYLDGEGLLAHENMTVGLRIDSRQVPASGEQLIARLGPADGRRVVVSAHIDSRHGTPGALDNAAGVCVLLALADLMRGAKPPVAVELLPFNGEDNFAAYGEMAYLGTKEATLADVALNINIDAVGRRGDTTAISFYACPDSVRMRMLAAARDFDTVAEGPEWPMSDHMVFAMRGIPAMAVTSSGLNEIAAEVAHTALDVPNLVDPALVDEAACYIRDAIFAVWE